MLYLSDYPSTKRETEYGDRIEMTVSGNLAFKVWNTNRVELDGIVYERVSTSSYCVMFAAKNGTLSIKR